jgi:DNA-binding CsgD family transcriptional regulator
MRSARGDSTKATPAHAPSTGFVLVDSSLRPIYANAEAVKILAYPENPRKTRFVERLLVDQVRAIIHKQQGEPESSFRTQLTSGRRRYLCRLYSLTPHSKKSSGPAMALLLERSLRSFDLFQVAGEFNLTQREREAVEFVAQGLTSKEIANRMRISPNTVKAFLRLVMIKTGVSTRSGIVGKFLMNQP